MEKVEGMGVAVACSFPVPSRKLSARLTFCDVGAAEAFLSRDRKSA